jgi:hypothetical protein
LGDGNDRERHDYNPKTTSHDPSRFQFHDAPTLFIVVESGPNHFMIQWAFRLF